MQGGFEQHTPAHAAVMTFGLLSLPKVPIAQTGVAGTMVFALMDFFINSLTVCWRFSNIRLPVTKKS